METKEDLGRSEILTAPPTDNPLPASLLPDSPTPEFSIDNKSERLEELAVRTLLDLVQSAPKPADRLKAADMSLKAIGKADKHKATTLIPSAQNVQINNFTNNPELLEKLRQAGQGISQVSEASTADITTVSGGRGA